MSPATTTHGNLIEFTPSNFVYGIAELDGRPAVVSGDDFTVRGGSNDASISAKREASESIAAEMRLPHVRLLDGMSGGGSVKTIEQAGRTYIPVLPGWHTVVDHLNIAPSVSLVLGFGRRFRCRAGRRVALLGDGARHVADDDRRSGTGRTGRARLGLEGGARARRHPHPQRGDRRRGRHRGARRSSGLLQFLSYLPTSVDELPPVEDWGDDPAGAATTG